VKIPPLVTYSVLRILAFAVPLGVMMLFPVFRDLWWLAALFAMLIGMSLSMLFLRRPLNAATSAMSARRERRTSAQDDAEAEDA